MSTWSGPRADLDIWNDTFTSATHTTLSYVCHDIFIRVPGLIHVFQDSFICAMPYPSYVRHEREKEKEKETERERGSERERQRERERHDSYVWHVSFKFATYLNPSVCHDLLFICANWVPEAIPGLEQSASAVSYVTYKKIHTYTHTYTYVSTHISIFGKHYTHTYPERWRAGVENHFQEFNEPYAPSQMVLNDGA